MNSIKSGKLTEIEKITPENDGDTLRILGILEQKNNTYYLSGLSGHSQELSLPSYRTQLNLGFPYLIIGQLQSGVLKARIIKELYFKKYSLDYYLKLIPSLHNELIDN